MPAREERTDRLTIMAPSSMMHPEPITMGPAMAKMVAFGWTMVPALTKCVSGRTSGRGSEFARKWRGDAPAPMVMSPLSSTSWQTTALEWMVNLSRLSAASAHGGRAGAGEQIHMGGMWAVSGAGRVHGGLRKRRVPHGSLVAVERPGRMNGAGGGEAGELDGPCWPASLVAASEKECGACASGSERRPESNQS